MASRARRTTEIGPTERAFIRDAERPTEGFEYPIWLRMTLDLRQPELFGPDNQLRTIWLSGGPDAIREMGIARAKTLRCFKVFGDPRT